MEEAYQGFWKQQLKQDEPQEAKEEEEPETIDQTYEKFKFSETHRYFTDYLQPMIPAKSRVELPNHPGSFALYSEGQALLDNEYSREG